MPELSLVPHHRSITVYHAAREAVRTLARRTDLTRVVVVTAPASLASWEAELQRLAVHTPVTVSTASQFTGADAATLLVVSYTAWPHVSEHHRRAVVDAARAAEATVLLTPDPAAVAAGEPGAVRADELPQEIVFARPALQHA